MTLRRTAPSNIAAVVPLATVKQHLRVDHVDEDQLIGSYLSAAARSFEARTGRNFGAASYTLTLDTVPSVIELPVAGVIAVSSMTITDADGVVQTIAAGDRTLTLGDFSSYLTPATGATWPAAGPVTNAVDIQFTAGLTTIEDDLMAALLLMTGHLYRNREATSADALHTVPMAVDMLLMPYRTAFV